MIVGKCFSGVNRGQRKKSDLYQTPYSMTEQLLENEHFDYTQRFLCPACGDNAIVKILKTHTANVKYSDIRFNVDFLIDDWSDSYFEYIIENPPFSLAFEFVQRAKEVATEKFAMLLPLSYLHGQKIFEGHIFTDIKYPLTKVYVFTRYPLLENTVREDGKYHTGMIAYAWYIWERKTVKFIRPTIKWINNQKYVVSSKRRKIND